MVAVGAGGVRHGKEHSSGWTLVKELVDTSVTKTGKQLDAVQKRIDKANYFTVPMPELEVRQAGVQLKRDFENTSAGRKADSELDLLRLLFKKFPPNLSLESTAYAAKLSECEVLYVPPPWTYDQMILILSTLIADGGEVNLTETKPPKTLTNTFLCLACGKPGHKPSECTTACNLCGMKACPGNYGAACIICTDEPVPANVKNAIGKCVPTDIHARLVAAHTKYQEKQAPKKEINLVEANSLFFYGTTNDYETHEACVTQTDLTDDQQAIAALYALESHSTFSHA